MAPAHVGAIQGRVYLDRNLNGIFDDGDRPLRDVRVRLDNGRFQTATDAEGNVIDNNINNEGLINADGGQVTLSVRRAGEIIQSVVNQEGVIEARSVIERNGRIFLSGGEKGVVHVAGTLDASGEDEGETGGTIQVTGEKVGLFDTANLDVSGEVGGGEILVGGDFQGHNPEVQNAFRTFVSPEALLSADAISNGDGGKIIVWADDITRFSGTASATGGSQSGNGGFIEISGKADLIFRGAVDASALNGIAGAVLFDPKNINVGIWRNIRLETDKDISEGVLIIVATMRFDVKYAEETASVKGINVKVA